MSWQTDLIKSSGDWQEFFCHIQSTNISTKTTANLFCDLSFLIQGCSDSVKTDFQKLAETFFNLGSLPKQENFHADDTLSCDLNHVIA